MNLQNYDLTLVENATRKPWAEVKVRFVCTRFVSSFLELRLQVLDAAVAFQESLTSMESKGEAETAAAAAVSRQSCYPVSS